MVYLQAHIFSQPFKNRKHSSIATIPNTNISGSQNRRFILRPLSGWTMDEWTIDLLPLTPVVENMVRVLGEVFAVRSGQL
jgi:hypothetical protein